MTKRRALDAIVAGDDGPLVDEAAARQDDPHAEAGEALDEVVRRDGGDHAVHVVVHGAVVDLRLDAGDAEFVAVRMRVRALGRRDQRLRRHAAVVQAVAAHLVLLDQHDLAAEGRRRRRDRQGRPSPRR